MADYKMYAFFTAEGEGKAGLTVTVTVYDSAGNVKVASGSATGLAGGMYRYTYTDTTADDYIAVFKTTDTTVDAKHIPAMVSKQQPMVEDVKAKTDNLPASPAAVGSAMTLTSAYDAAKNAASQASVNAIPTTPLLAANYTAPNNQGIADIKAKTDNLPASPAAVGSLMNLADGAITDAKIASNAISAAKIASNAIAGAKIATDAVTKIQTGLSTADNLAIVDGLIDTLIARLTETRAGNLDKLAIGAGNTLAHTGNANTFKADVSALALEATLTAMKGAVPCRWRAGPPP